MPNQVINFGCRLNAYESNAIQNTLKNSNQKDLIVFNSCSVTAEAERSLRQSIRKTAKENPNSKIVITGCASQIDPAKYANMKEVDYVLGNNDKFDIENYNSLGTSQQGKKIPSPAESENLNPSAKHQDKLFNSEQGSQLIFEEGAEEKVLVNDIMSVKDSASHMITAFEDRARAFVQIQNGCNHRCTFCIIPYGRGNSRSVPLGEVVAQIKKLVDNGYNEGSFDRS